MEGRGQDADCGPLGAVEVCWSGAKYVGAVGVRWAAGYVFLVARARAWLVECA
jgi:hypothetical protein